MTAELFKMIEEGKTLEPTADFTDDEQIGYWLINNKKTDTQNLLKN